MKTCTKCGEAKPLDAFHVAKNASDGLGWHCKVCVKARMSAYYVANRDKARQYGMSYRAANAERVRATRATYRAANSEKIRAASAVYTAANREKLRAANASWYAANGEKLRAQRAANPEKARAAGLKHRYSLDLERFDALLAAQGGACGVCGTTKPGGKGAWNVDHDHTCCAGNRSCGACVRGLLCHHCNTGLGMFRDSPDTLTSAIAYLSGVSSFSGKSNNINGSVNEQ